MIFAYDANYLIDNKLGIIVDAEGTRPNRIAENHVAETMIERVAERFALRPKRLGADTAYGTGRTLKRLVDRGIEPHIPVRDKSARPDGTFSRTDFQYGQARDLFICPGGKELKTSGSVHDGTTFKYLAKPSDCGGCPLNPSAPQGRGRRYANARALANTEAFMQSRRERKKVEMAFAHLKRILKLDRLRLRGRSWPHDPGRLQRA